MCGQEYTQLQKHSRDTEIHLMEKKLWGGRFSDSLSEITEKLTVSVQYDSRLYRQDIRGSRAHASMLASIGVLSPDELSAILSGLDRVEREIEEGSFQFSAKLEDVHMNIESRLTQLIGDAGKKLHTARSRNDQITLDMRLYVRDECDEIAGLLCDLIGRLTAHASEQIDVMMPGYTHMQIAQPVRLSHHLLAHAWALSRDLTRIDAAYAAADICPLGAGALAGVNYPTDRDFVRRELGFDSITLNSMDSVSDRDYLLDFLYACAMIGLHLSRFCEELVLWSGFEFGFIRLGDNVTTGSSIMPQKKNPDIAELVRGKSGRLVGDLVTLLTVMKGLPLTYNRDLQEDKEPLFDAADTAEISLLGVTEMMKNITFKKERMEAAARRGYSTATDLADYLALKGVPFRSAHEIVGSIVAFCERENRDFFALGLDDLAKFSPVFDGDAVALLSPQGSTERKLSAGSTSRKEVLRQIAVLTEMIDARLKKEKC